MGFEQSGPPEAFAAHYHLPQRAHGAFVVHILRRQLAMGPLYLSHRMGVKAVRSSMWANLAVCLAHDGSLFGC